MNGDVFLGGALATASGVVLTLVQGRLAARQARFDRNYEHRREAATTYLASLERYKALINRQFTNEHTGVEPAEPDGMTSAAASVWEDRAAVMMYGSDRLIEAALVARDALERFRRERTDNWNDDAGDAIYAFRKEARHDLGVPDRVTPLTGRYEPWWQQSRRDRRRQRRQWRWQSRAARWRWFWQRDDDEND